MRYLTLILLSLVGVTTMRAETRLDPAAVVHDWNARIIETIMEDGFSPAIASRIYAYANIAGYEAIHAGFPGHECLEGQLTALANVPKADPSLVYDWRVAAASAYKTATDKLLFRITWTDSIYAAHIDAVRAEGVPQDVIDRSREFGRAVGARIIAWGAADGYVKIQASSKYNFPTGSEDIWEPTPPDFMEPVDPWWPTMRPFTMRSIDQFRPPAPIPYSTDKASAFHKQAMEVYEISKNITDEQRAIALYWDDSPVRSQHRGHLMYVQRQISPPGHWIAITSIVARREKLDMIRSAEAYTLVSLALADGFMSCWDTKYHTNYPRPISYIRRYVDSNWYGLIQTPPFPEYTSGHSTISAAAAVVLTRLFGETEFTDDTEVRFGHATRTFPNFMAAAQEAGVSRLYGGIHFRKSCEVGTEQGIKIAEHLLMKVKTRKGEG